MARPEVVLEMTRVLQESKRFRGILVIGFQLLASGYAVAIKRNSGECIADQEPCPDHSTLFTVHDSDHSGRFHVSSTEPTLENESPVL